MDWLVMVVGNFWFWVVGMPMLVWGVTEVASKWIKHRERMAMIERGIHPDSPAPAATDRA